jgi:ComF family protein
MISGSVLTKTSSRLLDLLMPPRCLSCGDVIMAQGGLCATCWNKLVWLGPPSCAICGQPFVLADHDGLVCGACIQAVPSFDRARSVFRYDDGSKGMILAFKHGDRPGMARFFAPWMARAGRALLQDADLFLPVPLHRWRLLHRRYNQAALLALDLARLTAVPCRPTLLQRVARTKPQGNLDRAARAANVKGAISLSHPNRVAGRRIVLIDDVLTTGATVGECARVLRLAGAVRIDVLTLARVVIPQ